MSKPKYRSLVKKIQVFENFPLPETKIRAPTACSSPIATSSQTSPQTSNIHFCSDELSSIHSESEFSSVSSTSWSDVEFDSSQKTENEYNKIEEQFYGEAPDIKDKEYLQWTETFPYLRIVGHKMKIHTLDNDDSYETFLQEDIEDEECVIEENYNCVKNESPDISHVKNQIKDKIVNKIMEDLSVKLQKKALLKNSKETSTISTKSTFSSKRSNTTSMVETTLTNNQTFFKPFQATTFQTSPKKYEKQTLILPNINISRSAKNENEYKSLFRDKVKVSPPNYLSRRVKTNHSSRSKLLTLPPIPNQDLPINYYRSYSSTPRNVKFVRLLSKDKF